MLDIFLIFNFDDVLNQI